MYICLTILYQDVFNCQLKLWNVIKGVEIEDLEHCSQLLVKSMVIREKYMVLSQQSFPITTANFLNQVFMDEENSNRRKSSILTTDNKLDDLFDYNDGTA